MIAWMHGCMKRNPKLQAPNYKQITSSNDQNVKRRKKPVWDLEFVICYFFTPSTVSHAADSDSEGLTAD